MADVRTNAASAHHTAEKQLILRQSHVGPIRSRLPRLVDRNEVQPYQRLRNRPPPTGVPSRQESGQNNGVATGKVEERGEAPDPRSLLDGGPLSGLPDDPDLPSRFLADSFEDVRYDLLLLVPQGTSAGPEFANTLMGLSLTNKGLLYAMTAANIAHTRARLGDNGTKSRLEATLASKAVKVLNEQMSDHGTVATVGNIWAIACLANFSELEQLRKGQVARQSPLRELQTLQILGRTLNNRKQFRGFLQLIRLAGGLQAIQNPAIAAILSYVTLAGSTVNWQRHSLPCVPFADSHLDSSGRLTIAAEERLAASQSLSRLGSAFSKIWSKDEARPVRDLLTAIRHLCDFTVVLDSHIQGRPGRSSVTLSDQRNFAHHAIMSLPSAQEFTTATGVLCDELYEPSRLGCLVYSILTIFPVPPTTSLYRRVIFDLQRSLFNTKVMHQQELDRYASLAWLLSMAGLMCIGMPERHEVVVQLMQVLDDLKIKTLSSYITLLQGFLWHSSTSEIDGMEIWREVQRERKRIATV